MCAIHLLLLLLFFFISFFWPYNKHSLRENKFEHKNTERHGSTCTFDSNFILKLVPSHANSMYNSFLFYFIFINGLFAF